MDFNLRRQGFVSTINVTPFVDVMLVLLVIFMITAPMMTQGVDVDLPQTNTVQTLPQDSETLVLTVKKDGTLHIEDYQITREELTSTLQKVMADKDDILYLRADQEVPYGFVVKIMSDIKAAGVARLGVVAEPEED
ncbi:MAG: biopolymer transporter ExbD [Desulfovermiculus sp.]|nr:biopolymer transporter ExbD [Desulfovermiculus sp.]